MQVDSIKIRDSYTPPPYINPAKSYSLHIFTEFTTFTNTAFENFKVRFINTKSFIEENMAAIREDDQNKTAFLNALASSNFHVLRPALREFFSNLTPENQNLYLQLATKEIVSWNEYHLSMRCLHLLSYDQMIALIKYKEGEAFDVSQEIKRYIQKIKINDKFNPYNKKIDFASSELKEISTKIVSLSIYYLNLIITMLESFVLERAPKSAWDAAFQLDVYYRIISMPKTLFKSTKGYFQNTKIHACVFTALLSATIGFVYSYRKWMQPRPDELTSYTRNYTKLVLEEGVKIPLLAKSSEMQVVLNQLDANLHSNAREHCLIVGDPGTGKTTFLKSLAVKLAAKGIDLHYIIAADLLKKANSYDNKTAYDEIRTAIGRHSKNICIAIDDIHSLIKNEVHGAPLRRWLETGDPKENLPLFIGITPLELEKNEETKEDFVKYGYSRRFKRIDFRETDQNTTLAIMKSLKETEFPDLQIEAKLVEKIYEGAKKNKKGAEPANSLNQFKDILSIAKRQFEGEDLLEQQRKQIAKIEQLELQIYNDETDETITESEQAALEDLKNHRQVYQKNISLYRSKKETLRQAEFYLKTKAEQLKGPENSKSFLFERFFLLPEMKMDLDSFCNQNHIQSSVTEDMIEKYFKKA